MIEGAFSFESVDSVTGRSNELIRPLRFHLSKIFIVKNEFYSVGENALIKV